jgi:hypothetical protein
MKKNNQKELQSDTIEGYHASQHKDFQRIFKPFIELHQFTHIHRNRNISWRVCKIFKN